MSAQDDALKVGTNEMELVDFRIFKLEDGVESEGIYGINVAKVNEIIRLPKLTELPGGHEYIEGVFDLRGVVIPVVNLAKWMGAQVPPRKKIKPRVIITEFNNLLIGFIVHQAKRIRRINWKAIEPAHFSSNYGNSDRNKITGVTRIENGQILLILDLESVVQELGFYQPDLSSAPPAERYEGVALVLDDSAIARKIVRTTLEEMGFKVVEAIDGEDGLLKLESLYKVHGEATKEMLRVIISDVEMPKMDGFHFSARVKEDKRFASVPIIFSSSISDQFSTARGLEAGGEAYLVKFNTGIFHEEIARILGKSVHERFL